MRRRRFSPARWVALLAMLAAMFLSSLGAALAAGEDDEGLGFPDKVEASEKKGKKSKKNNKKKNAKKKTDKKDKESDGDKKGKKAKKGKKGGRVKKVKAAKKKARPAKREKSQSQGEFRLLPEKPELAKGVKLTPLTGTFEVTEIDSRGKVLGVRFLTVNAKGEDVDRELIVDDPLRTYVKRHGDALVNVRGMTVGEGQDSEFRVVDCAAVPEEEAKEAGAGTAGKTEAKAG